MEHCAEDSMLLNNYANLMMEKGNFSKAEQLFKKTLNLRPVHPNSYFGLALLYRVTGHPEESLKILERLFILMPKTTGIESRQIYTEARDLYSEIKAETEYCRIKKGDRTYVPEPGALQPASFPNDCQEKRPNLLALNNPP